MQLVLVGQVDEFDAHGVPTGLADTLHRNANHLASRSDEHEFIGIAHGQCTHHVASLVTGLHGDDALAATALLTVLLEISALADAVPSSDQQRRLRINESQRHHGIALVELDPLHTAGIATH